MTNIALLKRWTIQHQVNARRDHQALLRLDHTIPSLALKLGADPDTADALVLEARAVFTLADGLPTARHPYGETLLHANGLPLTPEHWLRSRLL